MATAEELLVRDRAEPSCWYQETDTLLLYDTSGLLVGSRAEPGCVVPGKPYSCTIPVAC